MSLWIALIWVVCAAICLGIFAFCRKRLADAAQHVSEEFENRINKILEAETIKVVIFQFDHNPTMLY